MFDQATAEKVASGAIPLNVTEFRVWMALISRADAWNYVRQRQSWLANEYGLRKQHFNRALLSLQEKDMVCRTVDTGSGSFLMISPFHFWKGNASEHKQGMAIYRRLAAIDRKRRLAGNQTDKE